MSEKNKILFAGDPHGCFANIVSAVFKYKPAAIILLGDYNLEAPLEKYLESIIGLCKIYWIPGNHDFDSISEYENLYFSALRYNNLHLKVIEIEGLRIAGLGGIFLGRNWRPGGLVKWESKQHWLKCKPSNVKKIPLHLDHSIWHHQYQKMKTHVKADILVTHEAPSCHRHGYKALDDLADAIGAKHIFHGHHHKYYRDQLIGRINVTGTSIGGIANLAGEDLVTRTEY